MKAAEARLNKKSTDPFDPTKVIDATLDSFPFFEFFPDKKDRLQKTLAGGGQYKAPSQGTVVPLDAFS